MARDSERSGQLRHSERERELFIGTQYSNLYTTVGGDHKQGDWFVD